MIVSDFSTSNRSPLPRGPRTTVEGPAESHRSGDDPAEGASRPRWEHQLRTELGLAAGVYATAHLVFASHLLLGRGRSLTLDLWIGMLLFLVGTAVLWKVMRRLEEPAASGALERRSEAGRSLVVTMLLSLSPCIWWFIYHP